MMYNTKSLITEHLIKLRDTKIITNSSRFIDEAIKNYKMIKENTNFSGDIDPENPNVVTWDNLESNIEKSTHGINSLTKAKSYFELLYNKVKKLPKSVRRKAFNVAILALSGVMLFNITRTNDELIDKLPNEVQTEIKSLDNPLITSIMTAVGPKYTPEPSAEIKIPKIRKHSDSLVEFLKYEEGSAKRKGEPVLTAYAIGDGMVTIGWGHAESTKSTNLVPGKTKISKRRAEKLLKKDIKWASDRLNVILNDWEKAGLDVEVSQGMYDSMVSLIFNMGIGNFRGSEFIQLVKRGELEKAKEKILSTNITYPGHVKRREIESKMFDIVPIVGKPKDERPMFMKLDKDLPD